MENGKGADRGEEKRGDLRMMGVYKAVVSKGQREGEHLRTALCFHPFPLTSSSVLSATVSANSCFLSLAPSTSHLGLPFLITRRAFC